MDSSTFRTEHDFLGERRIPADALYGIHALRARDNFPDTTPFHPEWYKAMGTVKQACYLTIAAYEKALAARTANRSEAEIPLQRDSQQPIANSQKPIAKSALLISAAAEVASGLHYDAFIVPAIQGGAGTSINMNINEIITNVALMNGGWHPGEYTVIDPIEDANRYQSTNDVVPTALKVAAMQLLGELEPAINDLRASVEKMETLHRNDLRMGYTQMQEAVPTSFGKLFSTYSEMLSRDWWRVSKCFERIKQVNLGGGAVGTGLAMPRFFIMEAIGHLQKLTGLPVTRSENLPDATSNLDSLAEVHATLKAHAVNLEKMVSDLRLLASDIANPASHIPHPESRIPDPASRIPDPASRILSLPSRQAGSSIMPGKVNPVIPEFVISAVHRVYTNDHLISSLAGQGCLELNAYLPVIGHALLESLKLLIACDRTLRDGLFEGLQVNRDLSYAQLLHSPAITTALIPWIGYHAAGELARIMKEEGVDVFMAVERTGGQADRRTGGQADKRTGGQADGRTSGQADKRTGGQADRRTSGQADKRTGGRAELMTVEALREILKPENLLKLGYTLKEMVKW